MVKVWAVIIGMLVVLDELFKYFALERLPQAGGRLGSVGFRLHKNFGIAFDIQVPSLLIIIISILVIYFLGRSFLEHKTELHCSVSFFLIMAGAFGNLFDRVFYGFVVDYVILFGRSAINLSDIMIILGIIGLFVFGNSHEKDLA